MLDVPLRPSKFGWAYIDDITIRFRSWEQAATKFPSSKLDLLSITLDKTTVAAPPDSLAAGVTHLSETQPDYLLLQCTLATTFTYLKKNIEFVEPVFFPMLSVLAIRNCVNTAVCVVSVAGTRPLVFAECIPSMLLARGFGLVTVRS